MVNLQRTLGFGLLGLFVGLVLFTVLYVVLTRADVAKVQDAGWLWTLLALILVPPAGFAAYGARATRPTAPSA